MTVTFMTTRPETPVPASLATLDQPAASVTSRPHETIGTVEFPPPAGITVNMMPFVLGVPATIPTHLHGYLPLVDACDVEASEHGKVGYLTITETQVHAGSSQRRGGAHTEAHPHAGWGGGGWGGGHWLDGTQQRPRRVGGLYLASNMPGTTRVWDRAVLDPGPGGSCEHLDDDILGTARDLDAGELVWMTDHCPHASMPAPTDGVRQFFRLVTSAVDLWYVDHSTANPLGVTPPAHVQRVTGSKF